MQKTYLLYNVIYHHTNASFRYYYNGMQMDIIMDAHVSYYQDVFAM